MLQFFDTLQAVWHLLVDRDPTLAAIVVRSLGVSASATVLATLLGFPIGAVLGVAQFRGRGLLMALLNSALAVPSVVIGLLIYVLLSRNGPLGMLGWLFSLKAMVLAQTILVAPLVMALTCQLVRDADRAHGAQFEVLGARTLMRSGLWLWDQRHALVLIALTAFGRAISEVGAVMVVGGNIEGFTRVMTTAIALETSKGDLPMAMALGCVLLAVVVCLNLLLALGRHLQHRNDWAHRKPWSVAGNGNLG